MALGVWQERFSGNVTETELYAQLGIVWVPPDGWSHLRGVFTDLGQAWVGQEGGWFNNVWAWAEQPSNDPRGLREKARKLRFENCIRLLKLFRTGELQAGSQGKGGGEITPMDPTLWLVNDLLWRFEGCAFNPDAPFDPLAPRTHWIWVKDETLLPILRRWRAGDRRLSGNPTSQERPHIGAQDRPKALWDGKLAEPMQQRVVDFFEVATQYIAGGDKKEADTALLARFHAWNKDRTPKVKSYGRTGFVKMLNRYLDGGRIEKGRWVDARH